MKQFKPLIILGIVAILLTLGLIYFTRDNQPDDATVISTAATAVPAPADTTTQADPALPGPEVPAPQPVEVSQSDYIQTDSGLQYFDLETGSGDAPQEGDIVSANYSIWLAEGNTFINSSDGQPVDFIMGAGQVFAGWEEGMASMSQGGQRQLIIPSELGLGPAGAGQVPPDAVLIMEVELVSFRHPPMPQEISESEFITTDAGVQYADLAQGNGAVADTGDKVTVEFTIWLDDGRFVASSADQGQPFNFAFDSAEVFPGWSDGMQGMAEGGQRQLVIPPDMALGDQGVEGLIPPNSTLVMEVSLLTVTVQPKPTAVEEADFTTTDSGLKYIDLVEGDGASPEAGQTVVVHYTGWLETGIVFDSSVERDQPFDFVLGQGMVIPGWDEGVADMKIGGKRQLVIPSDLAYGDQGSGPIPPGATLIFEVELLEIR